MENPIKIDDLGVPLFLQTPIFTYMYHKNQPFMYLNTPVPGMVWL